MIIKGASRRNIAFWSRYLPNKKKNDRAELIEKRGLIADDLGDMMREMQQDASLAPRCKNFMYIASFNPCAHEHPTEQQWEQMYEIFEKHRGIPSGQQRIVYEHEKNGRTHRHIIWNRIDTEKMRAFPDGRDLIVCEAAEKEIERELGLERSPHLLDRDPGTPRPPRGPKAWEKTRGERSQLDPHDVTAEVTAIFGASQNPADLAERLQQHGYQLALGDRRGLVILDSAGDVHSLARRLDGINTKQLNAFMDGFDRTTLPSVAQAKVQHQEQKIATLEADHATVSDQIQWEEALAKAAIAKEEKERRFVAPEDRERETPAEHSQEQPTFEEAATAATRDTRSDNLKGEVAKVWKAWCEIDRAKHEKEFAALDEKGVAFSVAADAKAFAAALDAKGISFAVVTDEEAYRSHRQAEFANEIGNKAQRFKEDEIVIVTEQRAEFRRAGQIIEPPPVHQLDQSLADKFVAALGNRNDLQGIDATLKAADTRAQQRTADWEAFWLDRPSSPDSLPAEQSLSAGALANAGIHVIDGGLDVVGGGLSHGEKVVDALFDLLDPPTTPAQREQAADRARDEREAQAERHVDFSKYTTQLAQQRQQQENEREAERRQRCERER